MFTVLFSNAVAKHATNKVTQQSEQYYDEIPRFETLRLTYKEMGVY